MHKPQVGQTVAEYRENVQASPIDFLDGWMRTIVSNQPKPDAALAQRLTDRFATAVSKVGRGNKGKRRKLRWELDCSRQALLYGVIGGHVVMTLDQSSTGDDNAIIVEFRNAGTTIDMTITELYPRQTAGDPS